MTRPGKALGANATGTGHLGGCPEVTSGASWGRPLRWSTSSQEAGTDPGSAWQIYLFGVLNLKLVKQRARNDVESGVGRILTARI